MAALEPSPSLPRSSRKAEESNHGARAPGSAASAAVTSGVTNEGSRAVSASA